MFDWYYVSRGGAAVVVVKWRPFQSYINSHTQSDSSNSKCCCYSWFQIEFSNLDVLMWVVGVWLDLIQVPFSCESFLIRRQHEGGPREWHGTGWGRFLMLGDGTVNKKDSQWIGT